MPDLLASLQDVLGERYQLEGELGHGGMATVYRALDRKLSRAVAIKVLPPEYALLVGSERFEREIRVAAALQHPNIVPLYDSGGSGELLYYIMPLIAGETLRERLERETQLPVEDALRIAREVADALAYAHAQGIVHRDIKPENILLASGRAMVADFGIARALSEIGGSRLTERGLAIGTPEYMSPEQAGGADQIDGRSDEYSLGCVLYEMLAGDPPFKGRTAQAVLARQIQERPPSLQVVRPTVSLELQRVIETALAKVPADRYVTATRFVAALEMAPSVPGPRRRRGAVAVAAAAAMVLAGLLWWRGFPSWTGSVDAAADTSRYAILPLEHDASVATASSEDQLLHDAFARWGGISVVDQFQVRDAMARRAGGQLRSRDALQIARELGAGRYVRAQVSTLGDSLRVVAGLYDASRNGVLLEERTVRVPTDLSGADVVLDGLAQQLLFRGNVPGGGSHVEAGTHSLPALQAYAQGQAAIQGWDLAAADSAFTTASTYDATYGQALLWLAVVRSWRDLPAAAWQSAAERSGASPVALSARDRAMSEAMIALGRGETDRACARWRLLSRQAPHDFASWFSLGRCVSRDGAVVPDPASASGWRFRSSYQEGITAYERAFQLLPSIHRSLAGGSYAFVRKLLKTSGSQTRQGRAVPPDTMRFAAYPVWDGDTLAFVPYPQQVLFARPRPMPQTVALATRHQRERFRQIAIAWVSAFPRSPYALEALAVSLDMLGEPSALDTLRRARALATTREDSVRVAGAEIWMLVRTSTPSDPRGLAAARALGDSVLRAYQPGAAPEPFLLSSIAALVGRPQLAAAYARQPAVVREFDVPAPLAATAYPLLVVSALGGPVDTLRALEQRVDYAIQNALTPPLRSEARKNWLARAATLAWPEYRFRTLASLVGIGDFFLDAEVAFLVRRDTATARRMFVDLGEARRFVPPADLTLDALYPEAQLLAALGDPRPAMAWLDPTLSALSSSDPYAFADPVRAGSLVRAMVLRADLADRVGDRAVARTWATAVLALWSNADSFAQPLLERMRRLAN